MTYRGHVRNGVVVLEDGRGLPDGTEVRVQPVGASASRRKAKSRELNVSRRLLKYAGKAKGLPSDASRNLDHYLYGHPKR
jgi:hypothetical protein